MSTHLIEEITLNSNENSLLLNLTNLSLDLGYQSAPLPIDFSDLERMVRSRQRQDVTERTGCGTENRSQQVARLEAIAVRVVICVAHRVVPRTWPEFDWFRALSKDGIKVELDISEHDWTGRTMHQQG